MQRHDKRPVFLVSTGRTGTKFFASFFARYGANVAAHHITHGTRRQNILNGMVALGIAPRAAADAWLARNTVRKIIAEPRRWVECNLYFFNSLHALRAYFPKARFVLVTRHPRSFCQSHIRWERQRVQSRIANQLVPFWSPVGYHEQLLGLVGDYHQRIRYYAKVWTARNAIIFMQLEEDATAIKLRFEDVFGAPHGVERLTELLRDLDIEPRRALDADALARKVNQTECRSADEWDPACDALIQRHCGDLMRRLGYAADG